MTATKNLATVAHEHAPTVFTVEQLANRWAVNVKTIYGMIDRGEIRALRVGRVIRIARDVIEQFESQGRVAPEGK